MKKSRFLQMLAIRVSGGMSIRNACKETGCSERQGYLISATDEFKSEVARLRSEAVSQAVDVLTSNATRASQALVRLLDSPDEKIVLASATKLLGVLPSMQDLSELRSRLDRLESQQALRIAR